MKNLITIFIMLVAVGCSNEMRMVEDANTMLQTELEKSKTENKRLQSENKKLKEEIEKLKEKKGSRFHTDPELGLEPEPDPDKE